VLLSRQPEHVLSTAWENLDHLEPQPLEGLFECDTTSRQSAHGADGYREELYSAPPQLEVALPEMYSFGPVQAASTCWHAQRSVYCYDVGSIAHGSISMHNPSHTLLLLSQQA
jgi:hypothetical protein